jgi:hypothetical protein
MDKIHDPYVILKKHLSSDELNIYTTTAIIIKNYGLTNFLYELIKCIICFTAQMLVPVLVLYDIIIRMIEDSFDVCYFNGLWINKVCSTIMCLFLTIFYIHRWTIFISQIIKDEKHTTNILQLRDLELYISESFFIFGFISNIFAHCINTFTGLVVLYQTQDVLNIVVNCCVLYYFNDISNIFVTDKIIEECKKLIKNKYEKLSENISHDIDELNKENMSYKKWLETYTGMIAIILLCSIFPILGSLVLFSLIGGFVYMPLCHS